MSELPVHLLVALCAGALGLLLGAVLQRTRFCTLSAIAEAVVVGQRDHLRAWITAAAIALIGTQLIIATSDVAVNESIYLGTPLFWVGAIIGGLLFGYGMVLASGCALRSFTNAGSGDLRALVALLMLALFAYMTMRGIIGPVQSALRDATATELGNQSVAVLLGGDSAAFRLVLTGILGAAGLYYSLASPTFRRSPRFLVAALGVGLAVPAAWLITGWLGFDDFEPTPVASLSFVQPAADTSMFLMTWTGSQLSFGVALVTGLLGGSALTALLSGTWTLRGFESTRDTGRYLLGGAMMGTGGVLAGGCTVGQGITGIATLSLGSFIATAAITAGAIIGVRRRERARLKRNAMSTSGTGVFVPATTTAFNACGN